MKNSLEKYRACTIQIATPYSTGTGFLVQGAGVIVTNFQVVQDNREVVVQGLHLPRQMAQVVFTDTKHDLALVALPTVLEAGHGAVLAEGRSTAKGDLVQAMGHPFGLKFSALAGNVTSTRHPMGGLAYLRHDAALTPGHGGGPLVNEEGEVVGVNVFVASEGEAMGLALPVRHLAELLKAWKKGGGSTGTRCMACEAVVFKASLEEGRCPSCGADVDLPDAAPMYEPRGIARTIEEILGKCGHDVQLARRGPNVWEVASGSAKTFISYYEPNGLIAGDAILCDLPSEGLERVYEFLLRKNYELEALSLSVRGQEIVLSLVIFDRYLSLDTGMKLFKNLFQNADSLDNVLVEQYGAGWKVDAED
ncbi:MAG: trypsin-like peptidase domain-containing protein [Saprospiraceae bacterium]|jgi:serine protease Do|nr:trypsin-like peptidase domain-containing protein [Saprospiraceae bacterium]